MHNKFKISPVLSVFLRNHSSVAHLKMKSGSRLKCEDAKESEL